MLLFRTMPVTDGNNRTKADAEKSESCVPGLSAKGTARSGHDQTLIINKEIRKFGPTGGIENSFCFWASRFGLVEMKSSFITR
jgi:hypothetical protein